VTNEELSIVTGGDAAATRPPGTNNYGETPAQQKAREDSESTIGNYLRDLIDKFLDLYDIDRKLDSNGNPR
jgi:hypothetical protein